MPRPSVFKTKNEQRHVVRLVKDNGVTGAHRILTASKGTKEADKRSAKLFPDPVDVSLPTLSKLARAAGLRLKRGRPSKVA